MRKGICTDDRLVGLHRKTGDIRNQLGTRHNFTGIDIGMAGEDILSRLDRHYDFLKRRISCALTKAVNRTFDLSRAIHDRRQRICHSESQIIVAVH